MQLEKNGGFEMTEKTLRDEFAMAALNGMASRLTLSCLYDIDCTKQAYKLADAMLAEREKGKKDDQ